MPSSLIASHSSEPSIDFNKSDDDDDDDGNVDDCDDDVTVRLGGGLEESSSKELPLASARQQDSNLKYLISNF